MSLINENKNIRIGIAKILSADSGIKLVNNCSNDAFLMTFDHFHEKFACPCLFDLFTTVVECFINLVIEVYAVGNKYDFVVLYTRFKGNCLSKHNHSKRLPASLGMPHHTANTPTFIIKYLDSLHCVLNTKILLVACYFLLPCIIENITIG